MYLFFFREILIAQFDVSAWGEFARVIEEIRQHLRESALVDVNFRLCLITFFQKLQVRRYDDLMRVIYFVYQCGNRVFLKIKRHVSRFDTGDFQNIIDKFKQ